MNPLFSGLAQIQFSWVEHGYSCSNLESLRAISNFDYPIKHMILFELLMTTIQ